MLRPTLAVLALTAFGCSAAVEPLPTGSTGAAQQTSSGGSSSKQGAQSTSAASNACDTPGAYQSCPDPTFGSSFQSCDETPSGGLAWGPCGSPAACIAPQSCTMADGSQGASCDGGACVAVGTCDPTAYQPSGMCLECSCTCLVSGDSWQIVQPPCDTPLVLAFDGQPVEFTRAAGAFDLVGRGMSVDTDWVSAATPWLAIDLDGDGAIDDGRELFGSMTELPDGSRARNGFEALAALDADGDGRITANDPAFSRLLLWRDVDQDRRSSPGELEPAAAAGLVSIELTYRDQTRCTRGSCEVERARFVFRDAMGREHAGDVVDVHLAVR